MTTQERRRAMEARWLVLCATVCLLAPLADARQPVDQPQLSLLDDGGFSQLFDAGGTQQLGKRKRPESCSWHNASTAAGITSWEYQLRISEERNATLPRAQWEEYVERSFAAVQRRLPALRFRADSRRAMIWHEVERALTTDDGRPLDKHAAAAGVRYPFSEVGILRLRLCLAVDAPAEPRHLLRPGEADLTLKLKGVDPGALPRWHEGLEPSVRGAALGVKVEDDVHCAYERQSYSAMYHRALRLHARMLRKLKRVRRYFPTLPKLLHLSADARLPARLDHYQSKTYWDVDFGGVPGTVQLYANSPSRSAALRGSACWPWELSMRITRAAAGESLAETLELIAAAGDVLEAHGWGG